MNRPVTKRAIERAGIHLMPSYGCRVAQHRLDLPGEVCPRTKEPKQASAFIRYAVTDYVFEVESLRRFITQVWCDAGGVEDAGQAMHDGLQQSLGGAVSLQLIVTLQCGQLVELGW